MPDAAGADFADLLGVPGVTYGERILSPRFLDTASSASLALQARLHALSDAMRATRAARRQGCTFDPH